MARAETVVDPCGCGIRETREDLRGNERRVLAVVILTALTMVVELAAGYWTDSLALLADGWHMASHAGALGLSAAAYWVARARAAHAAFVFGTGKVYALSGFTNAIVLTIVALLMLVEGISRIRSPETVAYAQALPIAFIGLFVNLISARLLHTGAPAAQEAGHEHEGDHDHAPGETHVHHDHNLRAAYLHVLADALTSVLAIASLFLGKYLGWWILDPLAGILGGVLILRWGVGLSRRTARHLLDLAPESGAGERIREVLCQMEDVEVTDLHLWEIGPGRLGCIVTIRAARPRPVGVYRERILSAVSLSHLTVEVHAA